MKVKFWGVRGSIAAPGPHTIRYGGNTTCIEIRGDDGTLVILDAGTGIFPLSRSLLKEMPISANIFITHSHWDHIQGMPFFAPLYVPGNHIEIYGAYDELTNRGIEHIMEVQLQHSYFPVSEAEMQANIVHTTIVANRPVTLGSLTITPLMLAPALFSIALHPLLAEYFFDLRDEFVFQTHISPIEFQLSEL